MNPKILPLNIINAMSPSDRKEFGCLTSDEMQAKCDDRLEKVLLRDCSNELHRQHIIFLHLSIKARELKGWPDLAFCYQGKPWAIELKSATGKATPEQMATLSYMKLNGWNTAIVRSFDQFRQLVFGL